MPKKEAVKSKRQLVREQREKRQRQQRLITILVVSGVAILIAGLMIVPGVLEAAAPVGEIVQVTPEARPLVNGKSMGDPNAPVKIEVWEDFQCPACRQYSEAVEPQVAQTYVATGKVLYTFRHFPFLDDRSGSKESDQAANASMCAMEQGKFWEYHDYLYANWNSENAGAFSNKRLLAFAEALGLDMTKFNQCFDANTYKNVIDEDLAAGIQAGVQGTPSVFVNGQIIRPGFVPTFDDIAQAVEAALAAQQ